MRLTLQIEMDNAAFEGESGGAEVARILREVAETVEQHGQPQAGVWGHLRDINGNRVGDWGFLEEDE